MVTYELNKDDIDASDYCVNDSDCDGKTFTDGVATLHI